MGDMLAQMPEERDERKETRLRAKILFPLSSRLFLSPLV